MLLRRITEHVKAQNWTAVALDFVIVVVGVFIGIQFSNWNEARMDRERALVYLERLDADFDIIRSRLEEGQTTFRGSVEASALLLDALRSHALDAHGDLPDDETLSEAFTNVMSGIIPSGASATFMEMVSSGDLGIIKSTELRNALYEYDEYSGIARDGWRSLRDESIPAIHEMNGLVSSVPDFNDEEAYFIVPVGFDRERFFYQETFADHLTAIMTIQANQYALVRNQLALAEQVEDLIAKERQPNSRQDVGDENS